MEATSPQARTEAAAFAQDTLQVAYRFKVGDKVIFTNCFGVCWGVKTITELDYRGGPTYHYEPTDTPWFSVAEEHLKLADYEDLTASECLTEQEVWDLMQAKHGFTPTDYGGCW